MVTETRLDRDTAIRLIKTALRQRSGKNWSVTGGRGTAWGWITISVPPRQRDAHGEMSPVQCSELAALLSLSNAHFQGVQIPASTGHYREYVARAEGRVPREYGEQYWD